MRILHKLFTTTSKPPLPTSPFTSTIQTRFKKPANTAQTRIESRTRDPKLDRLTFYRRRLALVLSIYNLVTTRTRGHFISVQLLTRWAPHVGLTTLTAAEFMKKYPHVFDVFTHPVRRNPCCKFMPKFVELLKRENEAVVGMESVNVVKVKKILMMSVHGRVHLHAIRLMRREFGLPEDFRESIIQKYDEVFRMVDLETVELVGGNDDYKAEVEKWREKEYREKWLNESETKYAFRINFPTGFKIVPGFREKLRNWQMLQYSKPYERMEKVRARTSGAVDRYEKRAVGIIHELLCLTVEKMVEVERFVHFKKDLDIQVNLREVLLKHPGIFYISTRGNKQYLFLREAYWKGCLSEGDMVYAVRKEMLDLLLLGRRHTRGLNEWEEVEEEDVVRVENAGGKGDGDFVLPFLERLSDSNSEHPIK